MYRLSSTSNCLNWPILSTVFKVSQGGLPCGNPESLPLRVIDWILIGFEDSSLNIIKNGKSCVSTITCLCSASSAIRLANLRLHLWSNELTGSSKMMADFRLSIVNSAIKPASAIHFCSPSLAICPIFDAFFEICRVNFCWPAEP